MKKLLLKRREDNFHWVGDGFPVRTIFSYNDIAKDLSPFLLMDHAGPAEFSPSSRHIRGVGEHPHRGFETVTIVYDGEVEHRDSAGGGGVIGAGDVQWMTAASGLVHEEKHGKNFAEKGGPFEMIQLWVNLPKKDKMVSPRYQGIQSDRIPVIDLAGGAGRLRVIAGEYLDQKGPAKTFTPINLWDLKTQAGASFDLELIQGHTAALYVISGALSLQSGETLTEGELAVFDREDTHLAFSTPSASKVLVLSGEPINEPIVGYGPFVMNTPDEIRQAFMDFQEGRMGTIGVIDEL